MQKITVFISLALIGLSLFGCKKYLDAKSNKKLVIPSSVQDLQALLEYYARVNQFDPAAPEKSADDYYLTLTDWSSLTVETDRRTYTWEKDYLFPAGANDWSYCYDNVYRANVVLQNLPSVERTGLNAAGWDNAKGHALFLRASSFLKIAWIWAGAYNESTAGKDLGIPLRLSPDINEPSVRSTLRQTYEQIIADAKQAVPLLPVTPLHVLRPSKAAAYALLARTYLSMRRYTEAWLYADSCLQLNNALVDYNTLNANASYPLPRFNKEVLFEAYMNTPSMLANTKAKIDSFLYQSYSPNDLRKTLFFKNNNNGTYGFRGGYSGLPNLFDGIAIDEIYLVRAECYARTGNTAAAMDDLNALLVKRWKTGTFVPYTAVDQADALKKILLERRKELLMRGLRWIDIKRLNKEGANIILQRSLNGHTYTLPPNDPRYALPIPEDVIQLSGMQQNPG